MTMIVAIMVVVIVVVAVVDRSKVSSGGPLTIYMKGSA